MPLWKSSARPRVGSISARPWAAGAAADVLAKLRADRNRSGTIMWTTLNFGKHAGQTLPQVVLSDPNWFFWVVSKRVFDGRPEFEAEADALESRARNIRIPKRHPKEWAVEYRWDRDDRFLGFHFVEAK